MSDETEVARFRAELDPSRICRHFCDEQGRVVSLAMEIAMLFDDPKRSEIRKLGIQALDTFENTKMIEIRHKLQAALTE